jgi:hypothetical protein
MQPKPWTTTDIALVRKLALEGCSVAQIMEKFPGRTKNSIIGMMDRNGIKNFSKQAIAMQQRAVSTKETSKTSTRPNFRRRAGYVSPYEKTVPRTPQGQFKTIMEIGFAECRAVVGPLNGAMTRFCSKTTKPESSWCPEHYELFHTKYYSGKKNDKDSKRNAKFDFKRRN